MTGEKAQLNDLLILKGMTTTQRDALSANFTDVSGCIVVYNVTTSKLNFYDGDNWQAVTSA